MAENAKRCVTLGQAALAQWFSGSCFHRVAVLLSVVPYHNDITKLTIVIMQNCLLLQLKPGGGGFSGDRNGHDGRWHLHRGEKKDVGWQWETERMMLRTIKAVTALVVETVEG